MKFGVTICNLEGDEQDDKNFYNLRFEKSIDMVESEPLKKLLKARGSEGAIAGDELEVILNRMNGVVSFSLNGTDLGEAFRDEQLVSESSIHFSLSFGTPGESAQIL